MCRKSEVSCLRLMVRRLPSWLPTASSRSNSTGRGRPSPTPAGGPSWCRSTRATSRRSTIWDKSDKKHVDTSIDDADPSSYDALVLPGGVANGDFVRSDERAVRFVRRFADAGKPIAVICHGGWVLAEADVVRGKTMTSWPSLKTDLRNAGATWVDREVVTDDGLVSSRKPDDLDAFCAKLIEEVAEGVHI
jgi:protease I